ncbi:hypothetical protein GCM10027346_41710 [Hymenobacter seoulensis]
MEQEAIKHFTKTYSVLICVIISVLLMGIATLLYPGGSLVDHNSEGFDWSRNFFSNLFAATALNGAKNTARPWAIGGMAFHSFSYGLFFMHMSQKIPDRHASTLLKLIGVATIAFTFLIVTPLHDVMILLAGSLAQISLLTITLKLFQTKRQVLKIASSSCFLTFYYVAYLYGSGDWGMLAIMQKIWVLSSIALIVALEYGTHLEDFTLRKRDEQQLQGTNA